MLACVGVSQNLAKAIGFELRIVLGLSLVATWFGLSLLGCLCALDLRPAAALSLPHLHLLTLSLGLLSLPSSPTSSHPRHYSSLHLNFDFTLALASVSRRI